MNIPKIAKRAMSIIANKQISQSLGLVNRNYVKGSSFQPQQQLKGITYKAIDKIGMTVSTYQPMVKKANGDAYENHPLYNLFNRPNSQQDNASDFIHLWGMLYEIYGESFWYIGAKGEYTGKIKEIWLLNPVQVELKFHEGELVGYVLHKENGEQVPLLLEEVIHDKRANPFNPWRGMSVMERASTYIDTEITTSVFTLNYMLNNASPSGIVSLPDMSKEAFTQFAQQWREGYEGPENAGKTAFIRGGEASFKAVGATLKDIDQKVTRDMAKDDVLAMFDVPKGLLGMGGDKGMGRNEIEPLEYIFAKYKIEPMMKRLDRIYSKILEAKPTKDKSVSVSHESPVPEDKEFIQKQNKELVNVAITVNEVRARIGLEPIDGGDVLQPRNAVPVVQEKQKVVLKKQLSKHELAKAETEEQEKFRTNLLKINEIYEIKVKRAISKFSANQEKKVIDNINATSKSFEEWLFSVKAESELLADAVIPILLELIEAQGKETTHFITGESFVVTREMEEILSRNILQISGVFNAETLSKLEKTLAEGQAKGESLAKLKKRVEQEYEDAKGYRAKRIARTESLKTSNSTAEEVYRQNGFTHVEWFINPNACEFCVTYAGKTKAIGDSFNKVGDVVNGDRGGQMSISYSDIDVPPLHPNCTCSLIPARG